MKILNNNLRKIFLIICLFIFLVYAKNASAANIAVKLSDQNINAGDTISAEVILNTEGKEVNVVEGNINIIGAENIEIKDISTADSAISNWVRNPSLSPANDSISFTGGTPGGFNKTDIHLFKIYFTAKKDGQVKFVSKQINVYANDGKATILDTKLNDLTFDINQSTNSIKNEWKDNLKQDNQAPADIKAEFGQDPALYDNKKFVILSAIDNESGLDYFEVKEGDRSPVRTSGAYVLQNQETSEPLLVFAFDKAGNISRQLINQTSDDEPIKAENHAWIAIIAILILVVIVIISFKIIRKKKV